MVRKSLNLPNFSWRSFRYAILATRGLGKVIWVIFPSQGWCQSEPILWFLQFLGSQWYPRLYKSLSTFLIFHGNHFGMPYLPPGGLGRSSKLIFPSKQWCQNEPFLWFLQFLGSQWYSRWLESVSTFVIFPGDRFGMLYLPPGGLGRSSESFFHHKGGVRANQFYDFCNF